MLGGFTLSGMCLTATEGEIIDGCFDELEGAFAFTLGAGFYLAGGDDLGGGFFLEEAAFAAMGQLLLIAVVLVRKVQGSNLSCLKKVSLVYVNLIYGMWQRNLNRNIGNLTHVFFD